jgi:hypothetical protein
MAPIRRKVPEIGHSNGSKTPGFRIAGVVQHYGKTGFNLVSALFFEINLHNFCTR